MGILSSVACVSITQNFSFRQMQNSCFLFSVASKKRKTKGVKETTESCSSQVLTAHQISQSCPRLPFPSLPERPGLYISEAEASPWLCPAQGTHTHTTLRLPERRLWWATSSQIGMISSTMPTVRGLEEMSLS